MNWETLFLQEISQAQVARSTGNEGKARVCARRAAGIVSREFLLRQGISMPGASAYMLLDYLHSMPGLSNPVYAITDHLLRRITPDHQLPVQADLIAEAQQLASELLEKPIGNSGEEFRVIG